ncbi:MAG: SMC-Scp complex subunit ScpB [Candidatus Kapaibacterium sp.]
MQQADKPYFLKLGKDEQKAALEAVIFSAEEPLSARALLTILIGEELPLDVSETPESDESGKPRGGQMSLEQAIFDRYQISRETISDMVAEINADLAITGRPFQIVHYGGGYQFATRQEYGELVTRLMKSRTRRRLSQAALESLAIIAYRQPVTKPEVEQIRGVNSNEVINSLVEKKLVRTVGRKDVLGKPLLYGTTPEFLITFGLNTLEDLPKLREIEELAGDLSSMKENLQDITINIVDKDKDEAAENTENDSKAEENPRIEESQDIENSND